MCKCIAKANKALKPFNTRLDTETALVTLPNNSKGFRAEILIPTTRIEARGPKAQKLVINFCPLCGEDQRVKRKTGSSRVETSKPGASRFEKIKPGKGTTTH